MEKICTKCGLPKDAEQDFSVKGGGRSPWCKQCHRDYTKNHYGKNKAYYQNKANSKRRDLAEFLNSLKTGPCTDCGAKLNPWQMDFDHVRGTKKFNVSHVRWRCSKRLLLEEVAKCELVCANCHRQRTHDRICKKRSGGETANTPDLDSGS